MSLNPGEITWRYELALLYQEQGLLDEAHAEARRCARMAPQQRAYRILLKEIHQERLRR